MLLATLPREREITILSPINSNEALLSDYLASKRSERTRRIYLAAISEFLAIVGNRPLAEIGRTELADYASAVTAALDSGAAKSTIALRVQSVRGFLKWANEEGVFPINPARVGRMIERPRIDGQRQFPVLSSEQAAAMLAAATSPRDEAIIAVLFGGGLRVAEVEALSVEDLAKRPDGRLRLNVQGKGRKRRDVPLPASASAAVLAYLASGRRKLGDTGALFVSHDRAGKGDGRMTSRSIARVVTEAAKTAGINGERVSPHALRHTAAVHWLKSGLELHEVARLLGHASITVTQRYVDHIRGEDLESRMPEMIGSQ